MKKNQIVIIADVHIRFASRHEEYKTVFERLIKDVKKLQPRRIVITGDLFHIKITLSPKALSLAGWFLCAQAFVPLPGYAYSTSSIYNDAILLWIAPPRGICQSWQVATP